jgi:hypothetical protein
MAEELSALWFARCLRAKAKFRYNEIPDPLCLFGAEILEASERVPDMPEREGEREQV